METPSSASEKSIDSDLILVEGIDAPQARILTLTYRTMVKSSRLGLVGQGDALDWPADLDFHEFQRG